MKLTDKQYRDIWELAHRGWLESGETDKTLLLCKTYTKAFISWLTAKGLTVKQGKIVKDEATKD